MTLYVTAKTKFPDVLIDFIELELNTGEIVSLTWDESGINRNDVGFDARYKGVQFGEGYANAELINFKIDNVEIYSLSKHSCSLTLTEMVFEDNGTEYAVTDLHYIVNEEVQ